MLHLHEILALGEGERVMRVIRRSLWTALPGLVAAGLFIALPFFFLFPLIRLGFVGAVLICASLAGGMYLALKTVLLWDANVLVFTDRRFVTVKQEGLWNRRVIEAPLAGASVEPGRASIFGRVGRLTLTAPGLATPVSVDGISSPDAVARSFVGLRDAEDAGFRVRTV